MRISNMVQAVDAHACGEPGRVIVGGVLDVPGTTMFDKMCHLRDHADGLRLRMLREPRGYPAANCNLILPSSNPEADAGFVIMEQVEYPGMSGTNTICVTTVLLETGMLPMREPVTELTLESPAGLIRVRADCANGKVKRVTFRNVPAFAAYLDTSIEVPHLGTVTVDVAYGGMFYVIADAARFGLRLTPDEGGDIVRIGEMIKAAAREQCPDRAPGAARLRRRHDRAALRPPSARRRRLAELRRGLHGHAGLEQAEHVDGRHRPLAVRDWHVREDGDALREGKTAARPGFQARRRARHGLHRPARRGDEGRQVHSGGAHARRAGMDHRHGELRRRPGRPVPRRIHCRRHLVNKT